MHGLLHANMLSLSDVVINSHSKPLLVQITIRQSKMNEFGVGVKIYMGCLNFTSLPSVTPSAVHLPTLDPLFLLSDGNSFTTISGVRPSLCNSQFPQQPSMLQGSAVILPHRGSNIRCSSSRPRTPKKTPRMVVVISPYPLPLTPGSYSLTPMNSCLVSH